MRAIRDIQSALLECYEFKTQHDPNDIAEIKNNEGWIEALKFVLANERMPIDPARLSDKIKSRINLIRANVKSNNALNMISGGFCSIIVLEPEEIERKEADHEFYILQIKYGVQSDVENTVHTVYAKLDVKTLEYQYL